MKPPTKENIILGCIIAIFAGMIFWKFQKPVMERIQAPSASTIRELAAKKHN